MNEVILKDAKQEMQKKKYTFSLQKTLSHRYYVYTDGFFCCLLHQFIINDYDKFMINLY